MNLRFYIISTLTFLVCVIGGFYVGGRIVFDLLFSTATNPYGEEALVFVPYLFVFSFLGSFVGLLTALIIVHKLGKKWGNRLNFGGHPVFKLVALSFFSFLGILIALLFLNSALKK